MLHLGSYITPVHNMPHFCKYVHSMKVLEKFVINSIMASKHRRRGNVLPGGGGGVAGGEPFA